jgi:hypothetical protein
MIPSCDYCVWHWKTSNIIAVVPKNKKTKNGERGLETCTINDFKKVAYLKSNHQKPRQDHRTKTHPTSLNLVLKDII